MRRSYSTHVLCKTVALAGVIIGVGGCSDPKASDQSINDRQDAALKDPFGYGPKLPASEPADQEKQKKSLKSDWDRFWNP